MLDALQFVKGAVAKKDYQPALTHFHLSGGRVTGFNGQLALSSPILLDVEAMPRAVPFVRAIERCTQETAVYMTPGGKLALKSGRFRAYIECHDDSALFDMVKPEGEIVKLPRPILPALRILSRFIGEDASRPWAMGILLHGETALATNNIVLVEYWLGAHFPISVCMPRAAVEEIIRIDVEPQHLVIAENSLTLMYPSGRWLRTTIIDPNGWPNVSSLLDSHMGTPRPIVPGLFDAVETLIPFTDEIGHIYFREGQVLTSLLLDTGSSIELAGVPDHGAFNHKYLMLLKDVATLIDFAPHPYPCPFTGDNMRGIILGLRAD